MNSVQSQEQLKAKEKGQKSHSQRFCRRGRERGFRHEDSHAIAGFEIEPERGPQELRVPLS